MEVHFSPNAIAAIFQMAKRVDFPRVILFIKMPRSGDGPAIGFVLPDWGEVSPLSNLMGLEVYVDEPSYLAGALAGRYIDMENRVFFSRPLPAPVGVALTTMTVVEK